MGWRLIPTNLADPYYVTAADDTLITQRTQNHIPNTLHFYQRNHPTISIGRSRSITQDINLPYCTQHNIHLIRRTTGGGTIYTDPGCLIYSLTFDLNTTPFTTPTETFQHICTTLATALKKLNIETTYKPPNDLLLNHKKISGSGIIKKHHYLLIHGTILHSTNLTHLHNALTQKNTVTTLTNELPNPPTIIQIQNKIQQQFQHLFSTTFTPASFTKSEQQMIQTYIKNRYQTTTWNLKQ